jgi:hypothetical protein
VGATHAFTTTVVSDKNWYSSTGLDSTGQESIGSSGWLSLLPDDRGGVAVYWLSGDEQQWFGQHLGTGTTPSPEYLIPGLATGPAVISGSGQIAYSTENGSEGFGTMAMDMVYGGVLWVNSGFSYTAAALVGGSVLTADDAGVGAILDRDGNQVDSPPLPGYVVPTAILGDTWIGQSLLGNGIPTAYVATPVALDMTAGSPLPGGSASQNNGPPYIYKDMDKAAVDALNFIFPFAVRTGWEWGGLICRQGNENRYLWSGFVTSHLQESVAVQALASCSPFGTNGTPVGDFHTHVPIEHSFQPSFGDYSNANGHRHLTYYLMTADDLPNVTNIFRYAVNPVAGCANEECTPADPGAANSNVFHFVNGVFIPYTPR